nr:hypothetical protein [Sinorhizobium medicae]
MRTLIHEVVADLDDVASQIVLVIHWVGGVHTELRLPKRRRGQRNATPDDIVEAVRQLVLIANDDVIAGVLNRNGLTTGNGNRWTRERVTALRSYRRIPVFRPQIDGFEPWLNLGGAAKLLGVTPKTLRLAAEAGEIEGTHPLPEGPWIFSRSKLASTEARQILDRARQNPRHPILFARIRKGQEPVLVQAFRPETVVEGFAESCNRHSRNVEGNGTSSRYQELNDEFLERAPRAPCPLWP